MFQLCHTNLSWVVATQLFFYVHPDPWGFLIQFDEHIFQMGWFNHQPVSFRECNDFCVTFVLQDRSALRGRGTDRGRGRGAPMPTAPTARNVTLTSAPNRRRSRSVRRTQRGSRMLQEVSKPLVTAVITHFPYHPCMVYLPNIYHKNQPNVDKYSIHGWYGV